MSVESGSVGGYELIEKAIERTVASGPPVNDEPVEVAAVNVTAEPLETPIER